MYLRLVVQLFYGNRSFALLFLPFFVAGYIALNLFFPYHAPESAGHFGFWGPFLPQATYVSQALAPLLVLAGAFILNAMFNRNDFMERNNFIASLMYVTFMSAFHSFYYLDGFAIAQFLVILALYQVFHLHQNEDGRKRVFNAGFLFGVACTVHPTLITVALVVFWLIWVVRPFVFRESLLLIIGFVIPLVYGGFYSSMVGHRIQEAQISSASAEMNLEDVVVVGGVALFLIFLSIGTLSLKIQQSSIRLKKLFRILLIVTIYALLLTILEYFVFHKKEVFALVFVPLTFVLPYAFGYKKQRDVTTVVFYLLFLFSVGKFLYPLTFLTGE